MAPKTPPAGYHTITPAIVVRDAEKAIDFYKRAFAAEELSRMKGPDGNVVHAELKIGDSIFMLGEESPNWGTKSPVTLGGVPGSLHIYVADADAAFQRAVKAGAKPTAEMENAFWGDRYGKVTDPFGHQWGIATRVRDLSFAEQVKAGEAWMAKFAQGANA